MAQKRKKILFGADFIDEDVTRKGRPKKGSSTDDDENTQQLDMSAAAMPEGENTELLEKIQNAGKKASGKKTTGKEAPKPRAKRTAEAVMENYDELDEEAIRIASVVLFGIGILLALAVFIPGSDGWRSLHNMILGFFGVVSIAVPPVVIYSAVVVSKRKKGCGKIIGLMILWIFLSCTAVQVFFSGATEEINVGAFISKLWKDGAEFKGGGVFCFPLAALFLWGLGRIGAMIVTVVTVFSTALICSGKELDEFLRSAAKPFIVIQKCIEGVRNVLTGGDFEDAFDDEEDDENEEVTGEPKDRLLRNSSYKDLGNGFCEELDADESVNSRRESVSEEKPLSPQERRERDEFSRMFDIPLPGDNIVIHNTEETAVERITAEPEKAQSDLDIIISKAVEKKAMQDRLAAGEPVEEKKPEPQMPLYILPGLDLLTLPSTRTNSTEAVAEMNEKAKKIVDTFKSFGVEVAIRDIYRGPSITRYEIQPGVGVKVSKIRGLEDDIALSLAAQGVRLEAPVPGKSAVGIEVPNINKDTVTLREILSTSEFRNAQSKLAFAVGKDITGNAIVGDITKMPHVIIAGTTGSGKSVCTRSIIMSILYKAKPDEVKIILIDPKVVEFKVFEGIPHLLIPIVTEAKKAAGALNWAVNEMMRRYNTFADIGANDLKSYNELAEDDEDIPFMPQIVIFIDELADMMLVAGKEVEDSICRLAQMGRAAGMHLVVATQRPTTDVITGLIKANIPSRIALSVMSQVDSRTIIDMAGADKLLGNGDMLYMPIGTSKPIRIQGCFASAKDINETLSFIRSQATGEYDSQIVEAVENFIPQTKGDHGTASESGYETGSDEDFVFRGAEVAVNNGQISTTLLQRKLKLGYARASRIMDELEERGIIGPSEGSKPRKVLMSKLQFDEWKARQMEEI